MAEEFQLVNVLPKHDDYRVFVTPQWPWMSGLPYVIYRCIIAIGMVAWVVLDAVIEGGKYYKNQRGIWLIYATNWCFILLALSEFSRAAGCLYHYLQSKRKGDDYEPSSYFCMFLWLLLTTAANCALVTSLAYWIFIAGLDTTDFLNSTMCMVKHSLNSAYVLIDLFICASPIRILHMLYPIVFGFVYAVFNVSYFLADGEGHDGKDYIYRDMHWEEGPLKSLGMCLVGFVVAATMQIVLFAVYELRLYVYSLCYNEKTEQTTPGGNSVADVTTAQRVVHVTSKDAASAAAGDNCEAAETDTCLPQPQHADTSSSVQIDMEKVSLRQKLHDDDDDLDGSGDAVC